MFSCAFLCLYVLSTIKLKSPLLFLHRKMMTWVVNVVTRVALSLHVFYRGRHVKTNYISFSLLASCSLPMWFSASFPECTLQSEKIKVVLVEKS